MMSAELILLRVALVLGLWAVPLAVGLIAHLGDWPRPAMASVKSRFNRASGSPIRRPSGSQQTPHEPLTKRSPDALHPSDQTRRRPPGHGRRRDRARSAR